eukprot:CAMPEP_0114495264 /NCGR_PEP_ID=MMETSP0109-20121206/5112_1 /TAXON_ID=29199 /ORGANISM="Chlorarachnion reptans, Strain CCCM449" /LENGTH=457 /DNA_ID=CAMNT_0001672395 /DNA_START=256 /DNA_END=1629 /DNA_ORIENTATION=-
MKRLALLSFCCAIDAADFAMLPGMLKAFEGDLNASLSSIGVLFLLQTLVAALMLPIWGHLGDKYQRKSLLILGCVSWGVFTLMCSLAQDFFYFTLYRVSAVVFLPVLSPITQSIIADISEPAYRGRMFGSIAFVATLGALLGAFVSTASAETKITGNIRGWRICLAVVGIISVLYAFVISTAFVEPPRQIKAKKVMSWKSFALPSFWLLVMQGIFGNIPWRAFGMYSPLWMELIGFTPLQVAIIGAAGRVCLAIAQLFSGYIGDFLHSQIKYRGRVYAAQISVLLGMVVMLALLSIIPKTSPDFSIFCGAICIFNLVATWSANSTNRPLIADITPGWSRASVYSYFHMLENVPSSLSGYLVSYLAEHQFGYSSPKEIGKLSDAERAANVDAITNALMLMMMIPWAACFLVYSSLHMTYTGDAVKTMEDRGKSLTSDTDDEDDEDLTKVKLLAHGRRG